MNRHRKTTYNRDPNKPGKLQDVRYLSRRPFFQHVHLLQDNTVMQDIQDRICQIPYCIIGQRTNWFPENLPTQPKSETAQGVPNRPIYYHMYGNNKCIGPHCLKKRKNKVEWVFLMVVEREIIRRVQRMAKGLRREKVLQRNHNVIAKTNFQILI